MPGRTEITIVGDAFCSPPVTWSLHTDRKRAFFDRVREITGS